MPEFTADELQTKSYEELAVLGERNHPQSAEAILINAELQRRQKQQKQWYEKPPGTVILTIMASVIASLMFWAILHFCGPH